jgi:hypothetical protein
VSGCLSGLSGSVVGAAPGPEGLAVDCRDAVYVVEKTSGFARIERFGEPGTAPPPCAELIRTAVKRVRQRLRIRVRLNRRRGTATLLVRVPGAGALRLRGRAIRLVRRRARRAGWEKLPIRPKGKARHRLLRTGKLKVRARLKFRSDGGDMISRVVKLTLRKSKAR